MNDTAELDTQLRKLGEQLGIQEINAKAGDPPTNEQLLQNQLLIVEYLARLSGQNESLLNALKNLTGGAK